MAAALVAWLPRLFAALLIVGAVLLAARTLRWAAERSVLYRIRHENLRVALGRVAYVSTMAVGLLIAATVAFPSFTIGSLIQLLGVGGIIVGFAFKDIFQNFIAGILLLVTNPFNIRDQIVVDAYEGTVEEIQARATLIRTYGHERVVVPNADLFTKAVTVRTAFPKRRMSYEIAVKGSDDPNAIREVLVQALLSGIDGVEKDPVATALLVKLGSDSTTFLMRWWSPSERGEYLIVQDHVLTAVHRALRAANLSVA